MQMPDTAPKKKIKLDPRVLLLIASLTLVLVVILVIAMPFLPVELRVVALLIPVSVFVTAAFTYWMVTPSTKNQVIIRKARQKASRLVALSKASPLTVQELFDDLPIALLRICKDGRIKQSNQFSRDILGIKEGATPNLSEIVSGLSRPVPDWLDDLSQRASHGEPKLVQVTGPKSEVYLHVSLISMDPRGGADLIAVISDATELKTLEAQFVQSQKMQAIGQLAGGIAHDFNNLLTAISGYCDLLLLRHDKGDPDYCDLIQINQNANRAAALVGQLLAFSRKQTLQPKVLDVDEALADMTHLLNRLVGEKVDLSLVYAENLPNVYADKRQLEQVIMNLVVNARDAMQSGGEVEISTAEVDFEEGAIIERVQIPQGRYVEVKVQDSGSGIEPKNLPHIFDPFFTTKDVGEGTGLGLSTVYGIVKQTGGFIFADSAIGKGTSVSVLLPVTEHVEELVEAQAVATSLGSGSLQGIKVLLVEDEVAVRNFAARALIMQDVEVLEAGSGEEALSLIKDKDLKIDIIISDVVMPGQDGPTWVREAMKNRNNLKVIFVSGYAQETFSKEFGEIKGAQFLAKPFTLTKLIQTVDDLCR